MEKRVPDDARDACLAAPYDAPDARQRPGPARLQKQILVAPALRATPSNLELSSPPRGSQVRDDAVGRILKHLAMSHEMSFGGHGQNTQARYPEHGMGLRWSKTLSTKRITEAPGTAVDDALDDHSPVTASTASGAHQAAEQGRGPLPPGRRNIYESLRSTPKGPQIPGPWAGSASGRSGRRSGCGRCSDSAGTEPGSKQPLYIRGDTRRHRSFSSRVNQFF